MTRPPSGRRASRGGASAAGALLLALSMSAAACGGPSDAPAADPAPDRPAREELASLEREPVRSGPVEVDAPLAPGTVVVQPGPFTDRVLLAGLTLEGGGAPVVTGTFASSTEVSHVLFLRLRADFLDAGGRPVGHAEQVIDGEDELPADGPLAISLAARDVDADDDAVSAVLSVPQFVTE